MSQKIILCLRCERGWLGKTAGSSLTSLLWCASPAVFPNKELPAMPIVSPSDTPHVSDAEEETPALSSAEMHGRLAAATADMPQTTSSSEQPRGARSLRPPPIRVQGRSSEDPGPRSGEHGAPEGWNDVITPSWGKKFKVPWELEAGGEENGEGRQRLPPSPSTPGSAPAHSIGDATPTPFAPPPLDLDGADATPMAAGVRLSVRDHQDPLTQPDFFPLVRFSCVPRAAHTAGPWLPVTPARVRLLRCPLLTGAPSRARK